jgi:hypothetical protein
LAPDTTPRAPEEGVLLAAAISLLARA